MSRLESFIRRLTAQRDCLNEARNILNRVSGPVLELGLGNGRTYDHLREIFPDREIFVFDRQVAAHPDCIPDDDHLFLGEFVEGLQHARLQISEPVALVHYDVGSGDKEASLELALRVGKALLPFVQQGTVLVGDQPLDDELYSSLPLPGGVAPGRYYMYRVERV